MADETKKVLLEVSVEVKEAIKNLAATKTQIQDLRKAQKELDTTTEEGKQMYEAYGAQIRELTKTARDQQKQIDNTIKSNKEAEGSNEQLKAKLSLLTAEYNKLSKAQKESAEGVELKNSIKGISDELKVTEGGLGDFRRSVAEYENKIRSALGLQDGFIGSLMNMASGAKETGSSFGKQAVSGVTSFGKALLSLLANPIVLIIAAIVSGVMLLVKAFQRSEESGNKLNAVFSKITSVFNLLLKALEPVANFIVDKLIGAFDTLTNIAGGALNLLSSGLKALGFENASKGVDNFKNSISDAATESEKLAKMEANLRNEQRKSERVQLDYQRSAEKLRQLRDDESKSIPERIKANKELGNVLQKQMQAELAIAKKALDVANLRIKIEGETTGNLDAQAEALNKISGIQERITGQQSEQLQNENSLRKEASDKRKEIAQKVAKAEFDIENLKSQAIIDKQNEILNNEKSNYSQRLDALAKVKAEQIKIIERSRDAELKQTDLTEKEKKAIKEKADYEIQKLKSDTEKTITDLEANELDKRLRKSAEALEKRKQQLSDEQSAELEKLAADYANAASRAKSQKELATLQKQYEKDKFDVAQKYRESDFNASVDALTSQLNLENLSAEQRIEIEKAIADAKSKYAQESAQIAIKANEDVVKNHEESAKEIEEIERQLKDKKEELYREIVSTINSIVDGNYQRQFERLNEETDRINKKYDKLIKEAKGNDAKQKKLDQEREKELEVVEKKRKKQIREQAIANRVFAVLNIILNTGSAVMAALAPPPIGLGPVAGLPLAVMAGGIGALQLAAALSAPLPKARKGALLNGKSHEQGGIPIEAEGGEAIINKKSTAMFRPLLSAINQAGGGVSFGAGGIAGNYKYNDGGYAVRYITNDSGLNKEDIKEAMKEAVKEIKIYATIEDIRREDKKYTEIEDQASF